MSRSPDVLHLLAEAQPERLNPPPGWEEHVARAVERIAADGPAGSLPRTRAAGRTRVIRLGGAGVAAAAAVAVAVAVGVAGPRSGPGNVAGATSAPSRQGRMDASHVLLAAAEHTATTAAVDGRYLTMQFETGVYVRIEAPGGTYMMFSRSGGQYWLVRSGRGRSLAIAQSLGAKPASPADEEAWRRNGSPTTVKVTRPKPADLRVAPGKLQGNVVDPEHLFAIGDENVSQTQLEALPTDPARLRDALLSRYHGGGSDMPTDRGQWLSLVATTVVIELPVSAAVRAAAYRLLATLPGVRAIGEVHDMRGRTGQAIAFTQDIGANGRFEVRLIIDPGTGQALGKEMRAEVPGGAFSWVKPGTLTAYNLVLVSKRTNDDPPAVDAK